MAMINILHIINIAWLSPFLSREVNMDTCFLKDFRIHIYNLMYKNIATY